MNKWTRRAFLTVGGLVGGGLALGVGVAAFAPNRLGIRPEPAPGDAPQPTTWVRIATDDRITVLVPHAEMGQGSHTALAMMVAEELDADWSKVAVEEAPPLDEYANGHILRGFFADRLVVPEPLVRGLEWVAYQGMASYGMQITGGSISIRGTGWYGLRVAGAAAKEMLVEAAAAQWGVDPAECTARASVVTHAASGRSASYGALATAAATRSPPMHPRLKPRAEYAIVGRPQPRFDVPLKVDGRARYAVDVRLPGMLHAAIVAAPVHGGRLQAVDAAAAERVPGVQRVVRLERAVAVVATDGWTAQRAIARLRPTFTDEGHGGVTSETQYAQQAAALDGDGDGGDERRAEGDVARALADARGGGGSVVEAEYRVPYLAHATLEPMSATVRVADGRCEIWTGVQDPLRTRALAAERLGLEREQVIVHNCLLGGGFGRRLPNEHDYVDQAVQIARELAPAPVQLVWSREEDTQQDYYRPAVLARLRGAVDAGGRALAWDARYSDSPMGNGALPPYAFPHQRVRMYGVKGHLRTGYWRAVDHTQHGFFGECFVDELAYAAKRDPFEFRRELLANAPRARAVLERVAALAGWGTPVPAGRGRGIAVVESYGSAVAQVIEVEAPAGDAPFRVVHVWCAVDCGPVINPMTAHEQIEGGILHGLSAALGEEITVREGRVEQSNFGDYELLRLPDAPPVTIEFLSTDSAIGGLGEPGLPPVAPALANALYAATGRRVRRLPLRKYWA